MRRTAGSTLLVHLDGALQRVLLVSLGDTEEVPEKAFREACTAVWRELARGTADEVVSLLHQAPVAQRSLEWKLHAQTVSGRCICRCVVWMRFGDLN